MDIFSSMPSQRIWFKDVYSLNKANFVDLFAYKYV